MDWTIMGEAPDVAKDGRPPRGSARESGQALFEAVDAGLQARVGLALVTRLLGVERVGLLQRRDELDLLRELLHGLGELVDGAALRPQVTAIPRSAPMSPMAIWTS